MRKRTFLLTPLVAAALLFPGAAAAAPELFCQTDDTTGISMPNGRTGVCVQQTATSRVLTLYTEEGLLIAQTDAFGPFGLGGADSSSLLQFLGTPVELLYCTAAHLNPETGAPSSQCLASDGTPGPSALTGAGSLQANATVGLLGSLQCPSSIHTRGIVHSPEGGAFEVQGSLLRFSDSTDGTTCETVTEELSTDYLGSASTLLPDTFSRLGVAGPKALGDALLPDLNSEEMRLLEAIANLDESQFELLGHLTRLTPEGWDALALHLEADGGAQIADDGSVDPPQTLSDNDKALGDNIRDVYNILVKKDVQLDNRAPGNFKTPLSLIYNLLRRHDVQLEGVSGPFTGNFKTALTNIDADLELLRNIPARDAAAPLSLDPNNTAPETAKTHLRRLTIREMLTSMDEDLGMLITNGPDGQLIVDLRAVVTRLQSIDVQAKQLTTIFPELVSTTLETIDFDPMFPDKGSLMLAFYRSLRAGFGRFKSDNCTESEEQGPCLGEFKTDLKLLFGNLHDLQSLFPEFRNAGIDLEPFEGIIDIAPPFPLFVMANGLHRIAPHWRDTTSHLGEIQEGLVPILDEVPRDFLFEDSQAKVGMKANFSPSRACTIFTSRGGSRSGQGERWGPGVLC